ncbi:hypothetical protein F0U63_02705 [Cystobacter fuscus]|nr:hypothetical protein F0U63_02705 [Cystobacter fuscus]
MLTPSHIILALCLLLVPLAVQAAPAEVESRLSILEPVTVSEYRGAPAHGLKLTFEKLGPNPALALFSLKDAREVLAAMEQTGSSPDARSSNLEGRVREEFEALYGPPLVSPPSSLESARWFQALKLSPRYMGDGTREAAVEMFKSPAMLLSVGMSMMLYMMAWAAPEPVFTKAFATAVTLGLLMTYTVVELHNVGMACLTLYREAEAARTREQLEAVAERFGKAMGGVGLRVLVTVAGTQLAKGLPEVPGGGLWARLSPPRFAFAGGGARGGLSVGTGARAQVSVANGTVVLMGVSANMTASAVASAVSSARTTGDCAQSKADDNHAHHLCTNKNNKSEITGGPWTPRFEELFARARMSLDDPANIVYLRGHQGPHPQEYHRELFNRLEAALRTCRTRAECRAKLLEELDRSARDVCTPGSKLNKLVTRSP